MAFVTQPVPHPGSSPAADAAWEHVRAMGDIQFAPLRLPPPPPPSPPPAWLNALFEWLGKWLGLIGHWLALGWHGVEWGAALVAALALVGVIWSISQRRLRRARTAQALDPGEWRPDAALASLLLADADRLAAAGRFDEAVHLLLRRSFDDIAANRPDWLTPASTAREIARLAALPAAARAAFGVIAGEVERSRYALNPLGHPDWARARSAYAAFAGPVGIPQRGAVA